MVKLLKTAVGVVAVGVASCRASGEDVLSGKDGLANLMRLVAAAAAEKVQLGPAADEPTPSTVGSSDFSWSDLPTSDPISGMISMESAEVLSSTGHEEGSSPPIDYAALVQQVKKFMGMDGDEPSTTPRPLISSTEAKKGKVQPTRKQIEDMMQEAIDAWSSGQTATPKPTSVDSSGGVKVDEDTEVAKILSNGKLDELLKEMWGYGDTTTTTTTSTTTTATTTTTTTHETNTTSRGSVVDDEVLEKLIEKIGADGTDKAALAEELMMLEQNLHNMLESPTPNAPNAETTAGTAPPQQLDGSSAGLVVGVAMGGVAALGAVGVGGYSLYRSTNAESDDASESGEACTAQEGEKLNTTTSADPEPTAEKTKDSDPAGGFQIYDFV